MTKPPRTTIYDIAAAAGVSITTVSDVLNGRDRVAEETADRVRAVMAELDYKPRPNKRRRSNASAARHPRQQGRRQQIALLVPDAAPAAAQTELVRSISVGAAGYLREFEHDLITTVLRPDGSLPLCIQRRQVDGVLVRGGRLGEAALAQLEAMPCVWLFSFGADYCGDRVSPDEEEVGRLAARHLLEQGCERYAVISPDAAHPSFHLRSQSFALTLSTRGCPVEVLSAPPGGSVAPLLAGLPVGAGRLGLFFAGYNGQNSPVRVEAMLSEAAISTGEGGVVLVGQADGGWLGYPRITIAPVRLGRTAAEQLVWRMSHMDAEPRRVLLAPQLVEEESHVEC